MSPKSPLPSFFLCPFSPPGLIRRFFHFIYRKFPLIPGCLSSHPLKNNAILLHMYMQSIDNARKGYGSLQLCIFMVRARNPALTGLHTGRNLWAHEILKSKNMLISGKVGYRCSTESSEPLYITQLCKPSKVGLQ